QSEIIAYTQIVYKERVYAAVCRLCIVQILPRYIFAGDTKLQWTYGGIGKFIGQDNRWRERYGRGTIVLFYLWFVQLIPVFVHYRKIFRVVFDFVFTEASCRFPSKLFRYLPSTVQL